MRSNFKRALAGISALTLAMGLTACGGSNSGGGEAAGGGANPPAEEPTATTTTAATVAINTQTMSTEQAEAVASAADKLRDVELENKEIKWLCHWDLNPDTTGKSIPVPLSLFQEKYGGSIKWYPTTWDARYSDLSTYVLGGEGVDFFQRDESSLPKGIVSGMFEPIDDYIDIDSELYDNVRAAMEIYSFKGKHYAFVNGVTPGGAVIYSAETIDENGLDDPWELYQEGNWNWDTFTQMLEEFCDPDAEMYGLDGWWSEQPLYLSAGVPAVSSVDGKLKSNLMDPTLEKAQNWMYSLYTKGLVFDKQMFDWSPQVHFMGEGKELFFINAPWALQSDPETWECGIDPEQVRWVPVPCPADAEEPFYSASASGYCLCKGAGNPEGVALYVECELVSADDEGTKEVNLQKQKEDFQWNDTLIEQLDEITRLAEEHPVTELASGVSNDLSNLLTYADTQGIKASMHGTDWATTRDTMNDTVNTLIDEFNAELEAVQ
ncbi:MAG: extracellular solute-binding protein [Oscillospiraceae bacterium]|nr:extracellular solute-binding protein [Oscillospiraceae bacterium]